MAGVVGFEVGAREVLFYAEGVEAAVRFEGSRWWVRGVDGGGWRGHCWQFEDGRTECSLSVWR